MVTSWFCASNSSTTWDPMNPEPPVTMTFTRTDATTAQVSMIASLLLGPLRRADGDVRDDDLGPPVGTVRFLRRVGVIHLPVRPRRFVAVLGQPCHDRLVGVLERLIRSDVHRRGH